MNILPGKKAYLAALLTAGVAGAQVLGYVVPEYVLTLLAALGLYGVRNAIK